MKKIKLGEICDLKSGYAFKSSLYQDSGIRIIRITNVQNGFIEDKEPKYYGLDKENEIQKYMLQENDLLISLTGNVGRVGLITKELLPAALNQRVACLRIKNNNDIDIKYIYNALNNSIFERKCILNAKGIAQMNLSTEWLREYEIDLPLKAIQDERASKLNKIQEIVDIRKKQIHELDELIKSQFVEMFGSPIINEKGYPIVDFINVVKLQRGYDLPNQARDNIGNIPVYGANGVLDKHINSKCSKGIVTGRSGTIGKVYYSFEEFWPLNTTLFSIETYGNNIIYLKYLLDMFELQRFVDATGVPTLNRNIVHKQKIINAPLELQNQFAEFVKQIDKQKIELQKSLEEIQKLQESLMNKYFG